jgi:O-antigen ligase
MLGVPPARLRSRAAHPIHGPTTPIPPSVLTRTFTGSLRESPATVPALAALALFVVWATSQAGYPLTHWAPGGLIVLALLAIALLAVPLRLAEIPLPVMLALGCLAAYTALSFLSILWADVSSEAWEGANRTLLYLMVFALFALWRARGAGAALLVSLWTLAMVALAVYVALRVDTASGRGFSALFAGERLTYPAGYPNATAAQWLMAFWPALLLARGERLPWASRGLLAGGAVVLADVALLSQSRGSLYATAVMIVLVFALWPQRLRTFATALPVALAIGSTAPLVLRVGDRIKAGQSPSAAVHTAVVAMFAAALLAGLVVALGAALEQRRTLSRGLARNVRRGVAAVALATLLVVIAGGLVAAGNPITRVRHSWESFEGGYATTATGGSRLLSGLGSNRYDFYRVALDEFLERPLVGIGVDNFQQQYLRLGRSNETPRYPHSVELRTLSQTGLLGALLAAVGLGAALVAAWRAMRRCDDPLGATVAAGALGGFAYWAVHGSFDWFWEFAGVGAPAFALLGIACALAPPVRPVPPPRAVGVGAVPRGGAPRTRGGHRTVRVLVASLASLLALAAAASLAAPWLSERQIQSAARIWPNAPLAAYSRLDDAAKLNPLSDRAYLVAGSIALRFGDLPRAWHEFSLALERVPDDAYATLELGAIASEEGERMRALALLERASRAAPRERITRQALDTVRSGRRVSVEALNRSILLRAERLA